jgi:hypothetical protein
MKIIPPRHYVPSDRPMVQSHYKYERATVDLPDLPMPGNVKNFGGISLEFALF